MFTANAMSVLLFSIAVLSMANAMSVLLFPIAVQTTIWAGVAAFQELRLAGQAAAALAVLRVQSCDGVYFFVREAHDAQVVVGQAADVCLEGRVRVRRQVLPSVGFGTGL